MDEISLWHSRGGKKKEKCNKLNYTEELSLACYMHAAGGVMDTGHGGMDCMLLQLQQPLPQDPDQMEVEVVGLELEGVEHQVYGQNLQADMAGIHCE